MSSYNKAGVNLEDGDRASKIMYEASRKTWLNREGRFGEILSLSHNFSGIRAISCKSIPDNVVISMGFDGIGTKLEVAERVGDFSTLAFDLFAMVCDDAVIRGAEPIAIGSILDVNRLGHGDGRYLSHVEDLASGMVQAAALSQVVVINGELAELGDRVHGYGPFALNWGASVLWAAHRDRLLDGSSIKAGMKIVGLFENGPRSNGISLLRTAFSDAYGDLWHKVAFNGSTLGDHVLSPSCIYTPFILAATGGISQTPKAPLSGAAHVTGGGIPGKLGRLLFPHGLGAVLDCLYDPPPIFLHAQKHAEIPDNEAYRAWAMGNGMLIMGPDHEDILHLAEHMGFSAQVVGHVSSDPCIQLMSRGAASSGQFLSYYP